MNQLKSQQLGEPDLKTAGLQIWVHGREYPDCHDGFDGNWLRVTSHCGGSGASVWVSGAIVMATDLTAWAHDCIELAEGKVDAAELVPFEPNLKVSIRPMDSLGHFAMHVQITPDHLSQAHSFEFEIDQTDVHSLARQCRKITETYPARGLESDKT